MIPHEKTLVKRLEDQPFALVGINSDNEERYRERRPEMGVTWPSFFDGGSTGGPIASQWGVTGWPTIYVLDGEGKIRYEGVRGDAMDRAVLRIQSLLMARIVQCMMRIPDGLGTRQSANAWERSMCPVGVSDVCSLCVCVCVMVCTAKLQQRCKLLQACRSYQSAAPREE